MSFWSHMRIELSMPFARRTRTSSCHTFAYILLSSNTLSFSFAYYMNSSLLNAQSSLNPTCFLLIISISEVNIHKRYLEGRRPFWGALRSRKRLFFFGRRQGLGDLQWPFVPSLQLRAQDVLEPHAEALERQQEVYTLSEEHFEGLRASKKWAKRGEIERNIL